MTLLLCTASAGCGTFRAPQWAEVKPLQIGGVRSSSADGYYADASAAILDRDYGRALDLLQLARHGRAPESRILNAFGVVYDKLGRFDLSARYYAQALALDPGSPMVQANLAYSHALQRQWRGHGDGEEWALPASRAEPPRAVPTATGPAAAAILAQPPSAIAEAPPAKVEFTPATLLGSPPTPALADPQWFPASWPSSTAAPASLAPSRSAPIVRAKIPPTKPRIGSLVLLDASGEAARVAGIRARLSQLGWSAGASVPRASPARPYSVIRYSASHTRVAHALARTLPGPVALKSCGRACRGVQLTFGADVRRWRLPAITSRNTLGKG